MEIFIILIMIGIGVAFAAAQSNRKKIAEAWDDAASQLNIRHNAGDFFTKPELYGKVRGCRIKVNLRSKSQSNHTTKYTCYEIAYPQALPFGLRLTEQSAFSGIQKLLGGKDIQIGDPTFDNFVVVRSHDKTQVTEFLNSARRLYVRRVLSMHPGAEITDSLVKWDMKGAESNPQTLVSNVKRLVDFAVNISSEAERSPEEPAHDSPEEPAHDSELDTSGQRREDLEAVFTVRDQSERHTYVMDSIPQPPDLVISDAVAPDSESDVTATFDQMQQDIVELLETASVPPATIDVTHEEQVDPRPTSSLDADDVCNNLFASDKISFRIDEIFERNYEGADVSWRGKLTRVDSYPFDLVFGNDPGTKAEFEVSEVPGDTVGSHTIKAVLQLPPEACKALSTRTGETINFSGKLVKCDAFMRVLFVADGRIEEMS